MIDQDTLKNIEDLHRLKNQGVITEDDFEKAKSDLLSNTKQRTAVARSNPIKEPTELPAPDDYLAWAILPLRRYADFTGRSGRKEFWMFQLVHVAVIVGSAILTVAIGFEAAFVLCVIALLGLLIPQIAVEVRRFHDQGKSGFFTLLNLVPYIGVLIVFVFMLIE